MRGNKTIELRSKTEFALSTNFSKVNMCSFKGKFVYIERVRIIQVTHLVHIMVQMNEC